MAIFMRGENRGKILREEKILSKRRVGGGEDFKGEVREDFKGGEDFKGEKLIKK